MGFDDLCSTIDFSFNFLTPAHPHAQSLFLFPIVFGINVSLADPWRYAAISIESVACNCGDLFNDRGISKKPEKHA